MKYIVIGFSMMVALLITGCEKKTVAQYSPIQRFVSIAGVPVHDQDFQVNNITKP
ncbi:NF038215 family lipoprotein [Acinetobacter sp.]|uniref:NF038215 family lipoprotein n=1 Tax=Acinetobacter sp. TaxID=472 RepID=UPI0031DC8579